MMKRLVILVLAMGLFAGIYACEKQSADMDSAAKKPAVMTHMRGKAKSQPVAIPPLPEGVVEAGNKTCPISGDAINRKDFVIYHGKRYGLCCAGCKEMFLKDPNKYIQKLRERGDLQ